MHHGRDRDTALSGCHYQARDLAYIAQRMYVTHPTVVLECPSFCVTFFHGQTSYSYLQGNQAMLGQTLKHEVSKTVDRLTSGIQNQGISGLRHLPGP